MDSRSLGMLIAVAGAIVVLLGLLIASGALGWFGRLPGDLRFGNGNVRVYVPFASMLLISVLLSLAAWVLRRL